MHNVVPSSKAYPYHLGRHCRKLGVDIRLSMAARSFIREGERVVGVLARDRQGREHAFRARRGVVLASGDYSGSREFKERLASPVAAECDAVNVTNTGDGHAMAIALGARIINGDIVHGPIMRFVPPKRPSLIGSLPPLTVVGKMATFALSHVPQAVLRPFLMSFVTTALGPDPGLYRAGAILVNGEGRRFADELGKPGVDLVRQPGGNAYIVFDRAIAQKFTAWPHFISTAPSVAYAYLQDYRRNRRDIYHEAPSAEGLAQKLGMQPDVLSAALASGRPDGRRLSEPPFYALGPIRSYVVLTDGGLAVSERLEVLGEEDRPIPGLFAAGSAGQGGLLLYGHGHHLAWAFVSGRLAGRNAALLQAAS
jgi:succinate dehydrogenase/fumarate reductase flavoprotein subunit